MNRTAWLPAGLILLLGSGCASLTGDTPSASTAASYTAPTPSRVERYCAWYGDSRDGVLYLGQSAFWSASRGSTGERGAEPRGDLDQPGPVRIGRFDLLRETWLDPLDVGRPGDRSGSWDVLAHPNGRLYFTTFFEAPGVVDLSSGAVDRFEDLGPGLNELARGPGDTLLVTRYPSRAGAPSGGVVVLDLAGHRIAEHQLRAPPGFSVGAKTPAFDPLRREIWITTDLLPTEPAPGPPRHDTYVLDSSGVERRRVSNPEIQFVAFAEDGTGYWAEVENDQLFLRIAPPGAGYDSASRILLDAAFPSAYDFAQDIHLTPDGHLWLTRWSGQLHHVPPGGPPTRHTLPRQRDALYYFTAASHGRTCTTQCRDVTVVCQDVAPVDSVN